MKNKSKILEIVGIQQYAATPPVKTNVFRMLLFLQYNNMDSSHLQRKKTQPVASLH